MFLMESSFRIEPSVDANIKRQKYDRVQASKIQFSLQKVILIFISYLFTVG